MEGTPGGAAALAGRGQGRPGVEPEAAQPGSGDTLKTFFQGAEHLFCSCRPGCSTMQGYLDSLQAETKGRRGPCTAVWRAGAIAYRCKTCQTSQSSAVCLSCFKGGGHENHDYTMYISESGGCCDCGDPTSWKPEGFCPQHNAETAATPEDVLGEREGQALRMVLSVALVGLPNAFGARGAADDAAQLLEWLEPLCGNAAVRKIACELVQLPMSRLHGITEQLCSDITGMPAPEVADAAASRGALRASLEESLAALATQTAQHAAQDTLVAAHTAEQAGPAAPADAGAQLSQPAADGGGRSSGEAGPAESAASATDRVSVLDVIIGQLVHLDEGLLHEATTLLLLLLYEPSFKYRCAQVFLRHYRSISLQRDKARRAQLQVALDRITVQLLNTPDVSLQLVRDDDILGVLFGTLHQMLMHASVFCEARRLLCVYPKHELIKERAYLRVVADLRMVLLHADAAAHLLLRCQLLFQDKVLGCLALLHGMAQHRRKMGSHVEYEDQSWIHAVHLEVLLQFHVLNPMLQMLTAAAVEHDCGSADSPSIYLQALLAGLRMSSEKATAKVKARDLATARVKATIFDELIAGAPVTAHLPLHRAAAGFARAILTVVQSRSAAGRAPARAEEPPAWDALSASLVRTVATSTDWGLLSHDPLQLLAWMAQMRARIWLRNGEELVKLHDAYYSAMWSEEGLDLDVALLQCWLRKETPEKAIAGVLEPFGALPFLQAARLGMPVSSRPNRYSGHQPLTAGAPDFLLNHQQPGAAPADPNSTPNPDNGLRRANSDSEWPEQRTWEEMLDPDWDLKNEVPEGQLGCVVDGLRLLVTLLRDRSLYEQDTKVRLRRELVHWLAARDVGYTHLQACVPRELANDGSFDAVLEDVADFVNPNLQQKGKYKLKPALWAEFDPFFLHYTHRDLHDAVLRALRSGQWKAHQQLLRPVGGQAGLPAAFGILSSPLLLRLIWSVLRYAMQHPSTRSDDLAVAALNLLALAMKVILSPTSSSSSAPINAPTTLSSAPSACQIGGGATKADLQALADGLEGRPGLLQLLQTLSATGQHGSAATTQTGSELRDCAEYMAQKLRDVVADGEPPAAAAPSPPSAKRPASREAEGAESASQAQERRVKAKARQAEMMARMQAQQAAFTATAAPRDEGVDRMQVSPPVSPSAAAGGPGGSAAEVALKPSPRDAEAGPGDAGGAQDWDSLPGECALCQCGNETAPLGLVAQVHCCNVPSLALRAPPALHGLPKGAKGRSSQQAQHGVHWPSVSSLDSRTGLHLLCCGHLLHQDCLKTYREGLSRREAADHMYDGVGVIMAAEYEFLCPICRRLGNTLLPLVAPEPGEPSPAILDTVLPLVAHEPGQPSPASPGTASTGAEQPASPPPHAAVGTGGAEPSMGVGQPSVPACAAGGAGDAAPSPAIPGVIGSGREQPSASGAGVAGSAEAGGDAHRKLREGGAVATLLQEVEAIVQRQCRSRQASTSSGATPRPRSAARRNGVLVSGSSVGQQRLGSRHALTAEFLTDCRRVLLTQLARQQRTQPSSISQGGEEPSGDVDMPNLSPEAAYQTVTAAAAAMGMHLPATLAIAPNARSAEGHGPTSQGGSAAGASARSNLANAPEGALLWSVLAHNVAHWEVQHRDARPAGGSDGSDVVDAAHWRGLRNLAELCALHGSGAVFPLADFLRVMATALFKWLCAAEAPGDGVAKLVVGSDPISGFGNVLLPSLHSIHEPAPPASARQQPDPDGASMSTDTILERSERLSAQAAAMRAAADEGSHERVLAMTAEFNEEAIQSMLASQHALSRAAPSPHLVSPDYGRFDPAELGLPDTPELRAEHAAAVDEARTFLLTQIARLRPEGFGAVMMALMEAEVEVAPLLVPQTSAPAAIRETLARFRAVAAQQGQQGQHALFRAVAAQQGQQAQHAQQPQQQRMAAANEREASGGAAANQRVAGGDAGGSGDPHMVQAEHSDADGSSEDASGSGNEDGQGYSDPFASHAEDGQAGSAADAAEEDADVAASGWAALVADPYALLLQLFALVMNGNGVLTPAEVYLALLKLVYTIASTQAAVLAVLPLTPVFGSTEEGLGPWTAASRLTAYRLAVRLVGDKWKDRHSRAHKQGLLESASRQLLPFLRRAQVLLSLLQDSLPPALASPKALVPGDTAGAACAEVQALTQALGLPDLASALSAAAIHPRLAALLTRWLPKQAPSAASIQADHAKVSQGVLMPAGLPAGPRLVALPDLYQDLYLHFAEAVCDSCGAEPTEPVLCLLCGAFTCCSDQQCRAAAGGAGPCFAHAAHCGGGTGLFLLTKGTKLLLLSQSRGALEASPYLDAHGEEDSYLRRGRPLHLSRARLERIARLQAASAFDFDTVILHKSRGGVSARGAQWY